MENELNYLVIPAAGLGTRMRTVDPTLPKEMLPVGDKPVIHYAVMEGLAAGIKEIIIIINKKKEMIRRYFEDRGFRDRLYPSSEKEISEIGRRCSICFTYQESPLGESDAISLTEKIVGDNSMAVIYPDNIYFPSPGALNTLASVFRRYGNDISALMKVTEKNNEGISNSGRLETDDTSNGIFHITKVLPKGAGIFIPHFKGEIRTTGISIYAPGFFEILRRARKTVEEGEFTDFYTRKIIIEEKRYIGCLLPGTIFDIGNPTGYRLCQDYVGRHGTG